MVVMAMSAERQQLAVRGARIQMAMAVFIAGCGVLIDSWELPHRRVRRIVPGALAVLAEPHA